MTDIWYTLPEHIELRKHDKYCLLVDRRRIELRVLHPSEAMVLSLLDGETGFKELTFLVDYVYRLPQSDAQSLIDAVFEKTKPFLAFSYKPQKGVRRYNPKTFVYPGRDEPIGFREPFESPLSMYLALTKRCNFKCRYCYLGSDHQFTRDLPKNVALDLIRQAEEMGITLVYLAGGEPLLYPHICEVVSAITKGGMVTSFSTNGSLLDDRTIHHLSDAGLESIQVSLDCPAEETHHFLTRTKNTFGRVLSGIRTLKSCGIWVRTRSVVTQHNWHLVGDLIDLLIELGVDRIGINPEQPGSCDSKSLALRNKISTTQAMEVRQTIKEKASQYTGRPIAFGDAEAPWQGIRDIVRCGNIFSSFVVHPTGEVNVCEMIHDVPELSYGNVHESSLKDIWLGPAHQRLLQGTVNLSNIDRDCSRCRFLAYCRTGCFNHSRALRGGFFKKDPRCPGPEKVRSQRLCGRM